MIRARQFLIMPGVLAVLGACAGPVETRAGYDGLGLEMGGLGGLSAVAVVSTDAADGVSEQARTAVAEALGRRNVTSVVVQPGAPRVTVSIAERPSSLAVLTDDGRVVSGAKRRRLLQNCEDRTQRLLLVLETAGAPPVRAWAEEDHCKGEFTASLMPLAERAVAALVDRSAGATFRFGRD